MWLLNFLLWVIASFLRISFLSLKFLGATQVAFSTKTQPHEYVLQSLLPIPWHVSLPPLSQFYPCFKSKDLALQCFREPRCLKRSFNIWLITQRYTDLAVCCLVVRLWSDKHFPDIQEKQVFALRNFHHNSQCIDRLRRKLKKSWGTPQTPVCDPGVSISEISLAMKRMGNLLDDTRD